MQYTKANPVLLRWKQIIDTPTVIINDHFYHVFFKGIMFLTCHPKRWQEPRGRRIRRLTLCLIFLLISDISSCYVISYFAPHDHLTSSEKCLNALITEVSCHLLSVVLLSPTHSSYSFIIIHCLSFQEGSVWLKLLYEATIYIHSNLMLKALCDHVSPKWEHLCCQASWHRNLSSKTTVLQVPFFFFSRFFFTDFSSSFG